MHKARCRLRFDHNASEAHWTMVKTILKYLRRIKDMFLIYDGGAILKGYSNASFQSDEDNAKSQSKFVFRLNDCVVGLKKFQEGYHNGFDHGS
ncbi:UNVERIFIED_CONTAM: hypothetical protein Sradi_0742800 [Sesamum radiatum]|uniref:Uncharacterized protein n=1 Tax=Sesamum radiatum TaxID=300843 RepID=A0AAW2VPA5_SESRA